MSVGDIDFGLELRKAYEQGYAEGKRDAVKWISVKDRLPASGTGEVLVIVNGTYKNIRFRGAYMLAEFDYDEGWIIEGYEEWEGADVKWWMELPEAPEEG